MYPIPQCLTGQIQFQTQTQTVATNHLNGNSIRCLITQGRKSGIISIDANIRHLKKVINVEQGKKDQEWSLQEHQNIDWSLLSVKISPSEKKMTTCQTKC